MGKPHLDGSFYFLNTECGVSVLKSPVLLTLCEIKNIAEVIHYSVFFPLTNCFPCDYKYMLIVNNSSVIFCMCVNF